MTETINTQLATTSPEDRDRQEERIEVEEASTEVTTEEVEEASGKEAIPNKEKLMNELSLSRQFIFGYSEYVFVTGNLLNKCDHLE